mmetsp:Transcript_43236/g.103808  ORF Transcript_43236/g.103808 Transcript_43236/m.103808 type:complete len:286 (+) Transcript_43236:465-1322(+)
MVHRLLQREQPALPVGLVRARVAAERVPVIARLGRRDRRGVEAQLVPPRLLERALLGHLLEDDGGPHVLASLDVRIELELGLEIDLVQRGRAERGEERERRVGAAGRQPTAEQLVGGEPLLVRRHELLQLHQQPAQRRAHLSELRGAAAGLEPTDQAAEALPRAEGGGVEGGEVRDVEGGQQRFARGDPLGDLEQGAEGGGERLVRREGGVDERLHARVVGRHDGDHVARQHVAEVERAQLRAQAAERVVVQRVVQQPQLERQHHAALLRRREHRRRRAVPPGIG